MKKIYTQPRIEIVATTPQQIICASGGIKAQISGYKQNTGGGFTQTFAWLAGIVCSSLLFLGTACSTNNPDQPKPQAELKPRTLIVTQQAVSQVTPASAVRRLPQATITDEGGTLDAIWSIGDEVFYRNLSYSEDYYEDDGGKPLYGVLEADKAERIASFAGDRVWCAEDDQLALIYPKIDKSAIDVSLVESQLTASYTISVAGQDGSLATLAKDFHHIYGIASVVSVTETTANAELAEMKSLMTVCKFSFEDKNHPGTSLPISTLEIKIGGEAYYVNTYPQQGTVSIAQNVSAWDVSVDPDWKTTGEGGTPLTITPTGNPTEVYVALFPDMGATYSFTVTSTTGAATDGTYTGTATATLNEGEYVVAPLKLTKN
ncbi:MAG: hypothetical protein IJQ32_04100 [Paludibacteraceae bacterium]|nr:hypothetical protein [Paludibacteraceae bacterium]